MPHVTLSPDPARLDVDCDWSEKELIKQVPGARWDGERKIWHVARAWAACVQLRGVFQHRLTIADDVNAWAAEYKQGVDLARSLRDVIDPGVVVPGLFPWQIADYQWLSVAAQQGCLLGNDQGTGKTCSDLIALAQLTDALPALVVCPNSVKRVWEAEAAKFASTVNVYVVEGSAVKRVKIIKQGLADPRALIVINYEALRSHSRLAPYGSIRLKKCIECGGEDETVKTSSCQTHDKDLNKTGVLRTIVFDEAQALKDARSQQTRAAWAVAHQDGITRRIATTGTPISDHVGDLWGIMHAVDPVQYPTRSAFIDRYALQQYNAFGGMEIKGIRPDTRAEFYAFFDPQYRRVTKAQAAPWLPDKIRSIRHAPLPPKMRKAYDELDEQLITRLDDGTILFTPNSLTSSIRLLQLSSAYGTVDSENKYVMTDNPSPKLDVLEEIIAEMEGRQLVVAAMSKQLINLAAKRLEARAISHGLITGDVGEYDRKRALDEFQAGRLRVLLFTVAAGGVGLTMTAADTIVFLQRSWSLVQNLQAEDRVHRLGSERHESIHVIDIIAPDTIEEWQIHKLTEKFKRLEEIRRDFPGHDGLETVGDDLRGTG